MHAHDVQFYDDPGYLAGRVAQFVSDALVSGGGAVALARPDARALIERELIDRGHDLAALARHGQLVLADADAVLSTFMDASLPDTERFRVSIGEILDRVRDVIGDRPLHIYGEMVDVLWARGNAAAVLRVEQLWCDLSMERSVKLMCGYALGGFDAASARDFEAICAHHDRVSPTEHLAVLAPDPTAARTIAQLEQRARALELEVERRRRLEQRMHRLLDITGKLAAVQTREEAAQLLIDDGVPAVGAVAGAVWEVSRDGRDLRMIACTDRVRGGAHGYLTVSVADDMPLAHAARTREPVYLGSLDEYAARFPASLDRIARVRDGLSAFALVPIIADGALAGVISFSYERPREFAAVERAFKSMVARQCAIAFERVALRDEEREARAEIELLYRLIDQLNRTDDLEHVYELSLESLERGARADRSAIQLLDDAGVMRFKAAHRLSAAYQQAVAGHSPWSAHDPAPEIVAVADPELDPIWMPYAPVFRAEGIRTFACVPLVHQRRLIGKLMLYRDHATPFGPRDLQLAATVAVHVAQAVERKRSQQELARAFAIEREAHAEAEEATRAREEILSVVSHDLRNPLGTIMMGAAALVTVDAGDKTQRVRSVAERIHRQAERMARQITDLVDFAGIQAGRLALATGVHPPDEILAAATELFGPLAQERGLVLEARTTPGLPRVRCDSERAVQVIANLVVNAIKVTPRGGQITIGAETRDRDVVFYVRDTGPGIDPEDLPKLFERYWRSKRSAYKGAGLGLSIARGIVDAHGGRIWAESEPGSGSTFYFSLSGARDN